MINFDGIGNDRRIPLIEVEFNNSMAVTGTRHSVSVCCCLVRRE